MNESYSAPDTNHELLDQFQLEYGEALNDLERDAILRTWTSTYPHLAEEIHGMVKLGHLLGQDLPDPTDLADFDNLEFISRGGMGKVYKARQVSLNRVVALKVRRGQLSTERQVRFLNEQRVLANLHQTHIVPIHTAGQQGPWQYFAMAYIEGVALSQLVRAARQRQTTPRHDSTLTLHGLVDEAMNQSRQTVPRAVSGFPPVTAEYRGEVTILDRKERHRAPDTILPAVPSVPLTLPPEYVRSMAQGMSDVAEALDHAHRQGIVHRDIKPGNILVDRAGKFWLIDFGLARCAQLSETASPAAEPGGIDVLTLLTQGVVGTPQYMAPEQFDQRADARSDVWGLGVTLYELLAQCRAFDGTSTTAIKESITTREPVPLERLVRPIPKDLRAICGKAMAKRPEQRYQTTADFAADLQRWLHHVPTKARTAWWWRRVGLWTWRNPAGALALGILAGLIVTSIFLANARRTAAESVAAQAQAGALAAEERAKALERESLIQGMQRLRLTERVSGWSDEVWRLAQQAIQIKADDVLKNHVAAAQAGLDAHLEKKFDQFDAYAVVFDAKGERLLIASRQVPDGFAQPAKVWNSRTEGWDAVVSPAASARAVGLMGSPLGHGWLLAASALLASPVASWGPVAFGADGTAFQLALLGDRTSLWLWDLAKRQAVRTFRLPGERRRGIATQLRSVAAIRSVALAAGSTRVAAGVLYRTAGEQEVFVWDATSGKLLHRLEAAAGPTLAFSPDNNFLAIANSNGHIQLWSLAKGQLVAVLQNATTPVQCLVFVADRRRRGPLRQPGGEWLLAAGDRGGTITIWDLEKRQPRTLCRGSHYGVHALAASPDGMTLASSGRRGSRLWDIATGRLLLLLRDMDHLTGVAFSRDGLQLTVSGITSGSHKGGVYVWNLQAGRGLLTLRGLAGPVAKVRISPNGRRLAALGHDQQLAVWDLETGHLQYVFETPLTGWADNVGLAFSPDSRQLALSASAFVRGHAKLWDLATGQEVRSWELPPALQDTLVFHPTGKLLLLRVETEDARQVPGDNAPPYRYPRVLRLRDLLSPTWKKPLAEIRALNWQVHRIVAHPEGSFFAAEGLYREGDKLLGASRAFNGLTGKEIWSLASAKAFASDLCIDATGRFLSCRQAEGAAPESARALLEMPSGKRVAVLKEAPCCLGPQATYWVRKNGSLGGFLLFHRDAMAPVVALGLDVPSDSVEQAFNAAGTHLAWGNGDGTVTVCNIPEVQQRLAKLRLGW
jgi:serine/threonine protein kinase/WD40 repeat protein